MPIGPLGNQWNDCFKCWYLRSDPELKEQTCSSLGYGDGLTGITPCTPLFKFGHFTTFGTYAAPIRWWLEFFPSERFLFINNEELKKVGPIFCRPN